PHSRLSAIRVRARFREAGHDACCTGLRASRSPSGARPAANPLTGFISNTEIFMNKDQVKGKAKDIAGKVQEKAGELTGSDKQQIKGLKNQAEGKIQKGVGDAKEALDDAKDRSKP
ncbi:MAG: CsbD family protein, partial [Burkholderiales bacterium]